MKVKDYIMERVTAKRTMHMTLIDPAKQSYDRAAEIAACAERFGTDAIMVGGSTDITQVNLDETVKAIKKVTKIPVIYFPSGAHAIASGSDAIYFMSMLNSCNRKNIIGEQVTGAPIIHKLGMETISMGYIIVEPGMKVGEVGEADLIKRDDTAKAVAYGLAAQFLGMDIIYFEAGSGAPEPVPTDMIASVKSKVRIPVIIGGGIKTPEQATMVKRAGADVIVTGTIVENGDYADCLEDMIKAVKG